MPVSPPHKRSNSSGSFSFLSPLKSSADEAASPSSRPIPLRTTRSFTSHQQQVAQQSSTPHHAQSQQGQQQQRRRANYRAAPPQSPKPHQHLHQSHYDEPIAPSNERILAFGNDSPSPRRRSVLSSGKGGVFKASSFDDYYNNNTQGYNDAFAIMGTAENTGMPPSSPSRRKRFIPASPKTAYNSGMRPHVPIANSATSQDATPPSAGILMPNFSTITGSSNNPSNNQLPSPSTTTRSTSPSIRSSSPLTLKMKQSLTWPKKNSSGRTHVRKGSDNFSDAVTTALNKDANNISDTVEDVAETISSFTKDHTKEKRRLRTRSPSPMRFLSNKGGSTNSASNKKDTDARENNTNFNIASKYSKDELESNHSMNQLQTPNAKKEDAESNAPSSITPSFINNHNIRSMSPARLNTSLRQRLLEKVPSSPRRRDYNQSTSNRERIVEKDATGGGIAKLAAASMSFDLGDDYEVTQINKQSDNTPKEDPATPNSGEYIINTTSYNVFENAQFLHAMGGSNDASLATNYVRTGDALCSSERVEYEHVLPLYYAGLGAILSRIRTWSMNRRPSNVGNDNQEHNLVYQDFVALAKSHDMNILLLAMASILLRAGNANFSLGRFETACRDYVSAQSYRSMRQQVVGGWNDAFVPSLVGKSKEDWNLLLEDAKLHGRISNNSACAQTKRKMYEEARVEYTKALQIKQNTLEKVHELSSTVENEANGSHAIGSNDNGLVSDIASTFYNIGLLRVYCEEPQKAEKAFKQSLSLRVKKFGLDDLGLSSTLCALGDVYFRQKRYDDAFRSYKESLRIWKFHRGNDRRTAELYYNIGLVFYSKGPYAKAKLAVMECTRIRRELFGDDDLLVASALHLLGLISTAVGDYEDALAQLQEAMATRQRLLGTNLSNHLLIYNVHLAIGTVYSLTGELEKAMGSFSVALMGKTMRLGKHHPSVADVLQSIGDAYIVAKEYSKAVVTLEEALRIRRSLLGTSVEVAETLNSLSLVHFCCDDTEHAIELTQQSLKDLKNSVSFDHFLLAKVFKNSGDFKQSIASLDDAIKDYTASLRVMTTWHGRDHISLSGLLNEIGVAYFKKEEFILAKESFAESLRIMRLYGEKIDKSTTFPTLSHLGHALYKNNELHKAADAYLESFKIQVSIITGDDCEGLADFSNGFDTFKEQLKSISKDDDEIVTMSEALGSIASILRYLGLVYHALGNPEFALNVNKLSLSVRLCQPFREDSAIALMAETIAMFEFKQNNLNSALEYFNQALEAKKRVQGESTIDVARTVNNLANIHFSLGNHDDAMQLYQEALEIKKHCIGEDSDDVANTMNNIAHVMVAAGKDQDALHAYHVVLKIRQDKYGKNHDSVASTLVSMSDVYIKLGKLEIAMTYLEQVMRIKNLQNESHDERVMENLASIYGKLGEWQKAESAFKDIINLKRASYGADCIDVAKTLDLLAVSYIEQDRCDESINHLQEALRIRKVCLGEEHDEVLASLNKLAFVYKSCSMTDKMLEVKAEFDHIQVSRKR